MSRRKCIAACKPLQGYSDEVKTRLDRDRYSESKIDRLMGNPEINWQLVRLEPDSQDGGRHFDLE